MTDAVVAITDRAAHISRGRVPGLVDLAAIIEAESPDDLWRWLVTHPNAHPSTLTWDAVGAFQRVHALTGAADAVRTAGLLCTDRRWRRVAGRLMSDIEATGGLSDVMVDELARTFLFESRLRWAIPERWVLDGTVRSLGGKKVRPGRPVVTERPIAPPLRRWAASRLAAGDPAVVGDVMARVDELPARDRDCAMQGLLDACTAFPIDARDVLIEVCLNWSSGTVRLTAMQLLATTAGCAAAAQIAASDPSEKIRVWGEQLTRSRPGRVAAAGGGTHVDAPLRGDPTTVLAQLALFD